MLPVKDIDTIKKAQGRQKFEYQGKIQLEKEVICFYKKRKCDL